MHNVFKSETRVVEVILKDSAGTVINPLIETIHDIEIVLVNRLDKSVIGQYSRQEKPLFTQAETTSEHMLCYIPSFAEATKGLVEAQVSIIVPDENMTGGYSISTQKGIILTVSE